MSHTYVLSWSRMFKVGSDDIADVPTSSGIFRVWSVLGQCLYVEGVANMRSGLVRFLTHLDSSDASNTIPGASRLFADWARVPELAKLRKIHLAEARRLKPRWGFVV